MHSTAQHSDERSAPAARAGRLRGAGRGRARSGAGGGRCPWPCGAPGGPGLRRAAERASDGQHGAQDAGRYRRGRGAAGGGRLLPRGCCGRAGAAVPPSSATIPGETERASNPGRNRACHNPRRSPACQQSPEEPGVSGILSIRSLSGMLSAGGAGLIPQLERRFQRSHPVLAGALLVRFPFSLCFFFFNF